MRIASVVRVRDSLANASQLLEELGCEVTAARHARGVTTMEIVIRKQLSLDRLAIEASTGLIEYPAG